MVVRFDRSKLNTIAKAKKLFVSETRFRLCTIDLQISILALAMASKKYPKPSVRLQFIKSDQIWNSSVREAAQIKICKEETN